MIDMEKFKNVISWKYLEELMQREYRAYLLNKDWTSPSTLTKAEAQRLLAAARYGKEYAREQKRASA